MLESHNGQRRINFLPAVLAASGCAYLNRQGAYKLKTCTATNKVRGMRKQRLGKAIMRNLLTSDLKRNACSF